MVTEVDTHAFGGWIVTFTFCTQRKAAVSLAAAYTLNGS